MIVVIHMRANFQRNFVNAQALQRGMLPLQLTKWVGYERATIH